MMGHFKDYEVNEVTECLKSLSKMFPIISAKLLRDAFDVMDSLKEIVQFVEYFKENYLKMYDFDDWSVFGKPSNIIIFNNIAGSHYNLLKQKIGIDPSLHKFEVKIKEIEADFEKNIN